MDRCGLFFCYFILFYVINEAGKRSGVDSKCAICIWKLLQWTHIMSKDLSIQVKQTIVRLQKQNQSIREIAGTFGEAKSTVWCILRKEERTGELNNIKNLDVQKDNSSVWSENPLHGKEKPVHNIQPREERSPGGRRVTIKSTIKRRLHQSKYRGFTTSCKQGQIWSKTP